MPQVLILRSTVSGRVPSALVDGQIAINEADGILFWPDQDGAIQSFSMKNLTVPTPPAGDSSTAVANTQFVVDAIDLAAAAMIGEAPEQLDTIQALAAALNNDPNAYSDLYGMIVNRLRIDAPQSLNAAQLAQVLANLGLAYLSDITSLVGSFNGRTGAVVAANGDYSVGMVTGAAPLASPAFTGTPTAPTPATADNSTKLATTAMVQAALAAAPSGQVSGSWLARNVYTSSQTVTIPVGATKALVRLEGAGGAMYNNILNGSGAGGGAGGCLEKMLTGLVAGRTLSLTIGAGANNSGGGSSQLASGTQSITTLTANGGTYASTSYANGGMVPGGTCSGGDINRNGMPGFSAASSTQMEIAAGPCSSPAYYTGPAFIPVGGSSWLGFGNGGSNGAGANGGCIIDWFS